MFAFIDEAIERIAQHGNGRSVAILSRAGDEAVLDALDVSDIDDRRTLEARAARLSEHLATNGNAASADQPRRR